MSKSARTRASSLGIALLCAAAWPSQAHAQLCPTVEARESFEADDQRGSDYFTDYYVHNRSGVYSILAIKRFPLDWTRAVHVLSTLEQHAEFMPGYRRIQVVRAADGVIYTALRFRPSFS